MAEIIRLKGTKVDVDLWLEANHPEVFEVDEAGVRTGNYRSYYDHDKAIHFIDDLVMAFGQYDANGNEITPPTLGGPAIMDFYLRGPKRDQQEARHDARDRARKKKKKVPVRNLGSAAVEDVDIDTIRWSGEDDDERIRGKRKKKKKKKKKKVV